MLKNNKDSEDKTKDSSEKIPKIEEGNFFSKSWVRISLGGFFTLIVFGLLAVYWFMPFNATQFFVKTPQNYNFNINSSNTSSIYDGMQFYPNMRYPSSNISYEINTTLCSLQKQNNIQGAFKRIENITTLHFYPVKSNPEISVTCSDKIIVDKSYFIAGEGGPTNITNSGKFDVIDHGEVLLLTDSNCAEPNVATHELLHALGFAHSKNINNIMYPIHYCYQTIGQEIPALINHLYSFNSLPDLMIENVSATLKGRYLNANVTIKNDGLIGAGDSTLVISSGNTKIRAENVGSISVGSGITFRFENLLAPVSVNSLNFSVLANFSELQKNNNEVELVLKK